MAELTDNETPSKAQVGPNVRRLIAHKMSLDAIPRGGGFADGLTFLSNKETIVESARSAKEWVRNALVLVREAAQPNPYGLSTDEEIAEMLLQQIKEREKHNAYHDRQ